MGMNERLTAAEFLLGGGSLSTYPNTFCPSTLLPAPSPPPLVIPGPMAPQPPGVPPPTTIPPQVPQPIPSQQPGFIQPGQPVSLTSSMTNNSNGCIPCKNGKNPGVKIY